jgi:hypothetical protein
MHIKEKGTDRMISSHSIQDWKNVGKVLRKKASCHVVMLYMILSLSLSHSEVLLQEIFFIKNETEESRVSDITFSRLTFWDSLSTSRENDLLSQQVSSAKEDLRFFFTLRLQVKRKRTCEEDWSWGRSIIFFIYRKIEWLVKERTCCFTRRLMIPSKTRFYAPLFSTLLFALELFGPSVQEVQEGSETSVQ